jgi:prolactin regulatory element-binding protein
VGGGGGAGRHGVKNSITLFDFSSRAPEMEPTAELEVSKDDSVSCLANLATKDSLILYAGIGGSTEERLEGRDMHFRSFEVNLPQSKTAGSSEKATDTIRASSKCQLFTQPRSDGAKKEMYQRLLKLSPPQRTASSAPNKRIGAIATGLAGSENEVVIFSATSNRPDAQDIIRKIPLKEKEANDLDILDEGEGRFQVAYALDHEVYIQDCDYDFTKRSNNTHAQQRKVYGVPQPDLGEKTTRSKIRALRWISPKHLLLVSNKPSRTGAELLVLHMYEEGPASIVVRKKLPKHVAAATDMDLALLEADASGAYQIVVAVGGADNSLSVFTLDYQGDSVGQIHKSVLLVVA